MSTRSRETVQPFLAAAEQGIRRASDATKRTLSRIKGESGPSEGNGTSPGALDENSATSLPRNDETTRTRPSLNDERAASLPTLKADEVASSTPLVEVSSATALSQKDKPVEPAHSSVEDIQTVPLLDGEIVVDSYPPDQGDRPIYFQAMVTAQLPRRIEDDSACEHKSYCVPGCWR